CGNAANLSLRPENSKNYPQTCKCFSCAEQYPQTRQPSILLTMLQRIANLVTRKASILEKSNAPCFVAHIANGSVAKFFIEHIQCQRKPVQLQGSGGLMPVIFRDSF